MKVRKELVLARPAEIMFRRTIAVHAAIRSRPTSTAILSKIKKVVCLSVHSELRRMQKSFLVKYLAPSAVSQGSFEI